MAAAASMLWRVELRSRSQGAHMDRNRNVGRMLRRGWRVLAAGFGLFFVVLPGWPQPGSAQAAAKAGPQEKAEKPKRSSTEEEEADEKEGQDTGEAKTIPEKKLSIDEQYVHENLEKYLSPTHMEWLPDGRVKLSFDFGDHKEDHESIFTPKVSKDLKSRFRWSVRDEWGGWWGWGTGSQKSKDGSGSPYWWGGLRISNEGSAHLNVWFLDDVEAEINYIQNSSSSPKQIAAVSFTNKDGGSLASKFGSQCALLSSGKVQRCSGTFEPVTSDTGIKMKLVVKGGKFEAYRDGKMKTSMDYTKKNFSSGRVGFVWSGGVGSLIHTL